MTKTHLHSRITTVKVILAVFLAGAGTTGCASEPGNYTGSASARACPTVSIFCGWGGQTCSVDPDGCQSCTCVPMLDSTTRPLMRPGPSGSP
ncbi:hypothetical protein BH10BDE1_BH10BDE1_00590 [soil metagenome]